MIPAVTAFGTLFKIMGNLKMPGVLQPLLEDSTTCTRKDRIDSVVCLQAEPE
jgi:hypothetical protein